MAVFENRWVNKNKNINKTILFREQSLPATTLRFVS